MFVPQQLSCDELLLENWITSEEKHYSTVQTIQTQDLIYYRKKDSKVELRFTSPTEQEWREAPYLRETPESK